MQICGMYTNGQELINNFNQVEIIAATENLEFITLSGTHLTKQFEEK